jgi:F0F1-type ATP synthase assembly protein I
MTLLTDERNEASASASNHTRTFWWGTIAGALVGLGLGYLMRDMVGWTYMTAVCGSIVGIFLEKRGVA